MITGLLVLASLAGAAEIQLIDAGSSPRSVVRYAPAVGSEQTVRLEMDVDMSMSMAGMAMPGMDAHIKAQILDHLRTSCEAG